MRLVLLSGGSGKRLWPLSNDSRSKQFLKTLKSSDNEWESMLQRVWRQLGQQGLQRQTYISCSQSHAEMIHNQIGYDVTLIVEPEKRDTFPAICLAASFFSTKMGLDRDEVITVMPVDPFVDLDFFECVRNMDEVLYESGADLALIGGIPTYASEKYGYIVPVKQINQATVYQRVLRFKEKPSPSEAALLIKQGALWNCGIFSFRLGYLLDLFEKRGWPTDFAELCSVYDRLPKISFDYEVVEKARYVVVLPYAGRWSDLGTWSSMTAHMETKLIGKGFVSEDCKDTHLINELDIPIAVLGVSDMVVAASPDGILVADKKVSHRIKDIHHIEQRPMFEERRWGAYRVLDYQRMEDGTEFLTKRLQLLAGRNLSYQYHLLRSEIWTVVAGNGEFVLDGKSMRLGPGDVVKISAGAKHGIKALTDLEIIEVQMGTRLIEEDITRLYFSWDELMHSLQKTAD
ncbi:sugar phosphate nucleotidyltransferase [Brevibacillus ruminantium]|uniref:Sugar phosphate nucleotidyltransferase n=1 Tax=Brevibacillus ruminantium TaxID=2950604 RepID=A0ABY4W844_9BACL|nr:sugar phosphate nucleotidyltransferase [Brevibacillus ruminantium]USG63345.1 sugar phosphate nucleotidyltransferase [Brevibacillus ruminantium]